MWCLGFLAAVTAAALAAVEGDPWPTLEDADLFQAKVRNMGAQSFAASRVDATLLSLWETGTRPHPKAAAKVADAAARSPRLPSPSIPHEQEKEEAAAQRAAAKNKVQRSAEKLKRRKATLKRKQKQATLANKRKQQAKRALKRTAKQRKNADRIAERMRHMLNKAQMGDTQAAATVMKLKAAAQLVTAETRTLQKQVDTEKLKLSNNTEAMETLKETKKQLRQELNHARAAASSAEAKEASAAKKQDAAYKKAQTLRAAAGMARIQAKDAKTKAKLEEEQGLDAANAAANARTVALQTAGIARSSRAQESDASAAESQLKKDARATVALGKRLAGLEHADAKDRAASVKASKDANTAHRLAKTLAVDAKKAAAAREAAEAKALKYQLAAEKGAKDFANMEEYVSHLADRTKVLDKAAATAAAADAKQQRVVDKCTAARIRQEKGVYEATRVQIPRGTPVEKAVLMLKAKKRESHLAVEKLHEENGKLHSAYEKLKLTRGKVKATAPLAVAIKTRFVAALAKSKKLQVAKTQEATASSQANKAALKADKTAAKATVKADAEKTVAAKDDTIAAKDKRVVSRELSKEEEIKAEEDQKAAEVMSELDDLAAARGAKGVTLMTWSLESNTAEDLAAAKKRATQKAILISRLAGYTKKVIGLANRLTTLENMVLQADSALAAASIKEKLPAEARLNDAKLEAAAAAKALTASKTIEQAYQAELRLIDQQDAAYKSHADSAHGARAAQRFHSQSSTELRIMKGKVVALRANVKALTNAVTDTSGKVAVAKSPEQKQVAKIQLETATKQRMGGIKALNAAIAKRNALTANVQQAREATIVKAEAAAQKKIAIMQNRVKRLTRILRTARKKKGVKSKLVVAKGQLALEDAAQKLHRAQRESEQHASELANCALNCATKLAAAAAKALLKARATKVPANVLKQIERAELEAQMARREASLQVQDAALVIAIGKQKRIIYALQRKAIDVEHEAADAAATFGRAKGSVATTIAGKALAQARKIRDAGEAKLDAAAVKLDQLTRNRDRKALAAQRVRLSVVLANRKRVLSLVKQAKAVRDNAKQEKGVVPGNKKKLATIAKQVLHLTRAATATNKAVNTGKKALMTLQRRQISARVKREERRGRVLQRRDRRAAKEAAGGIIVAMAALMASKDMDTFNKNQLALSATRRGVADLQARTQAKEKTRVTQEERQVATTLKRAQNEIHTAKPGSDADAAVDHLRVARARRDRIAQNRLLRSLRGSVQAADAAAGRLKRAEAYRKNAKGLATPISQALSKEARGNLADAKVALAAAQEVASKGKRALAQFEGLVKARRAKEAMADAEARLAAARLAGQKQEIAAAERNFRDAQWAAEDRKARDADQVLWSAVTSLLPAIVNASQSAKLGLLSKLTPFVKRENAASDKQTNALRSRIVTLKRKEAKDAVRQELKKAHDVQFQRAKLLVRQLPAGPLHTAVKARAAKLTKKRLHRQQARASRLPAGPAKMMATLAVVSQQEKALAVEKATVTKWAQTNPKRTQRLIAINTKAELLLTQASQAAQELPAGAMKTALQAKLQQKKVALLAAQTAFLKTLPNDDKHRKGLVVQLKAKQRAAVDPTTVTPKEQAVANTEPNNAAAAQKAQQVAKAAVDAQQAEATKLDAEIKRAETETKNAIGDGKAIAAAKLAVLRKKAVEHAKQGHAAEAALATITAKTAIITSSEGTKTAAELAVVSRGVGGLTPAQRLKASRMAPKERATYLESFYAKYLRRGEIGKSKHVSRNETVLTTLGKKLAGLSPADQKQTMQDKEVNLQKRHDYQTTLLAVKRAKSLKIARAKQANTKAAAVAAKDERSKAEKALQKAMQQSKEARAKGREFKMYQAGWENW